MRKILLLILILILVVSSLLAQEQAIRPRFLVDTPTAGVLDRGSFDFHLRLYNEGGLIAGISVGFTPRLMFGLSYGGNRIIGEKKIEWNPDPGINIRYLLIEETYATPAITIGFDSQGYGAYIKDKQRYTVKSRGFFLAASKNYAFWGDLGVHGGVNYSLERKDGDEDLNLFAGIDKTINPELSLVAEYDFAINDNSDNSLGSGKGYLNLGLRWSFAKRLFIEFDLKNLLKNRENVPYLNREIKIVYVEYF